ncbi:histone deacetylase [Coniosporium tulheliwenetii]|uniref:Histone deacetylase n=1 Tax=Coniosporium tulheliwenetii TaxID=3383036 RepID=A0ACC2YKP9_9PEZI|nr:histone deacetylase [Cladosporium sp. JES 115]
MRIVIALGPFEHPANKQYECAVLDSNDNTKQLQITQGISHAAPNCDNGRRPAICARRALSTHHQQCPPALKLPKQTVAQHRLYNTATAVPWAKIAETTITNLLEQSESRSPNERFSGTRKEVFHELVEEWQASASPDHKALPVAQAEMARAEPVTAASVAREYFRRELAQHEEGLRDPPSTVVILHDSCYGHRYSRPKTSKANLSMIVERPERIRAGVLGISAAYVRLGERHAGGRYAPHPHNALPSTLPFCIRRTARSIDINSSPVTNVHGTSWMAELKEMCASAEGKLATTGKELVRDEEGQPGKDRLHEGDLYLCPESLGAFQGALGGVFDGVDAVFSGDSGGKHAFVCIRPPGHHCSADFPSGFCWLNNVHVGIEYAAQAYGLTHAAIIDFDLHHGDGSQAITWERNARNAKMPKNTPAHKRPSIGYFSLHDINSYPCEYGDEEKVQNASLCIENAHNQTIWNVHLQPWKAEAEFWELYETRYSVLIDKARAFLRNQTQRVLSSPNRPQPKAAIFLSAGFDASEWESEGMQRHKVNVPTEFYARFTRDVVRMAKDVDTGVDNRIVSVLEGGYSDRALASGIISHLSGLAENSESSQGDKTEWWHSSCLTALEGLVNPSAPAAAKKLKNGPPSTFFSTTQSFSAKVVDPSKLSRSISGTLRTTPPRSLTPPPPDVDWATAAHELSKLLIPTDRQTRSCLPEELSEPKVKKERQSIAVLPPDPSGRQLRDRKSKMPSYTAPASDDEALPLQPAAKDTSRRKTMAVLPLDEPEPVQASSRVPSRRLSVASTISSTNGDRSTPPLPVNRTARPAPPNMQVKKVRAPGKAQVEKPPVPVRQPSVSLDPSENATKPKLPQTLENQTSHENDGMDQLASKLKRITIKVPPKEEYEARRQQREADAAKKAVAKPATRKAPPPKTTKAAASKASKAGQTLVVEGNGNSGEAAPYVNPTLPQTLDPSADHATHDTTSTSAATLTASATANHGVNPPAPANATPAPPTASPLPPTPASPPTSSTAAPRAPEAPPSDVLQVATTATATTTDSIPPTTSPLRPATPPPQATQFIPYVPHPSNTPQHHPATPAQPLRWLPPNSDAEATGGGVVSPGRKQKALPVFSADGVIPFGTALVPSAVQGSNGAAMGAGQRGSERSGVGVDGKGERGKRGDLGGA